MGGGANAAVTNATTSSNGSHNHGGGTGSNGSHSHGGITAEVSGHAHTLNIDSHSGSSGSASTLPSYVDGIWIRKL